MFHIYKPFHKIITNLELLNKIPNYEKTKNKINKKLNKLLILE